VSEAPLVERVESLSGPLLNPHHHKQIEYDLTKNLNILTSKLDSASGFSYFCLLVIH